ncbi:MAG: aminotransferase class III-fold pyridoxal phosphate-dependent enzyme [Planctomycetota bacterium]
MSRASLHRTSADRSMPAMAANPASPASEGSHGWLELERQHAPGVYPARDVVVVRGEGALLFDEHGKRYVDCASGQGVAALGHAHPRFVEAVGAQAARLTTCAAGWPNDRRAELVSRLAPLLPGDLRRIFLCNSGAEAVEAALKFARVSTGRHGVVALERGFHGRTFGALSATANEKYRAPFAPLVPGFRHVPPGDLDALDANVGDRTACILLEVVQGEGGVYPLDADFLHGARRLATERGALLVVDEVQSGYGRTGRMFACEHHDLEPDLLCLGKAIGGGIPMGAVAMGAAVAELSPGSHGSTFGGNPLSCAAALAVLDAFEDEALVDRARELGAWFEGRLRELGSPAVREVRGLGLMLAIELRMRSAPFLKALVGEGVIALAAGANGLRFLPPLVVEREQLEEVLAALESVLPS